MVIRDLLDLENCHESEKKNLFFFPSAQERFLAVIFDVLFFAPIFSILFFRFIKKLNITQVIAPQSDLMTWYFLTTLFLFLISFIFYQAISLYLKGTTLGKSFFKIKVVGDKNTELTWNQAFLRSAVWSLESLFLGISFLEVIAHDSRKTIHDKLAETQVITLKKPKIFTPILSLEKAFVRMIYICTFFIFSFMTTQYFVSKIQKSEKNILATMKEQNPCENEIKNMSTESLLVEWLFNSQRSQCLEKKVSLDFQLKNPEPMTLIAAYVMKSYEDDKRAEYKDLICKTDKEACEWADQYENFLKTKQLAHLEVPKAHTYFFNFWLAKVSTELKNYKFSNEILKKIELNDAHLNYFLELKLKNSVGLGDQQAVDSTLEVLSKILTEDEYAQVQKWAPISSAELRAPASESK